MIPAKMRSQYYILIFDMVGESRDKLESSEFLKNFKWAFDDEAGLIHLKSDLDLDLHDIAQASQSLTNEIQASNIYVKASTAEESEEIINLKDKHCSETENDSDRIESQHGLEAVTDNTGNEPILFPHHKLYPDCFMSEGIWIETLVPGSYILERVVLPLLAETGVLRMTVPYLPLHNTVLEYLKRRSRLGSRTKLLLGEQEKDHNLKSQKLSSQIDHNISLKCIKTQGKNILHSKIILLENDTKKVCLTTSYNFTQTSHYESAVLVDERMIGNAYSQIERFDYYWDHGIEVDKCYKRTSNSEYSLPNDLQIRKYYSNMESIIIRAKEEQTITEESVNFEHLKLRLESEGTSCFYGKIARICNAVIYKYVTNSLDSEKLSWSEISYLERLKFLPFEDELDKDQVLENKEEKRNAHRKLVKWMRDNNLNCLLESNEEHSNKKSKT